MPLDKFDNRDSDIWFNHRNHDRSVGRIIISSLIQIILTGFFLYQ